MATVNLADLFTASTLTDVINEIPGSYSKIVDMGIFRLRNIPTTNVTVESKDGYLKLVDAVPYGAPSAITGTSTRTRRTFELLHRPLDAAIAPGDIRNLLALGSGGCGQDAGLEQMAAYLTERLDEMKMHHDLAREWSMLGALKGRIVNSDGTVVYDLFNEFGVTETVVDFQLSVATTDVKQKCAQVIRNIRQNLTGDVMTGIHAFVDQDFFNALIDHPSVKEVWLQWATNQSALGRDPFDKFTFAGITFEVYDATVTAADGVTQVAFFGALEGRAFPLGTRNTLIEYAGPADFNDTINRPGAVYYARVTPAKHDRGYEIHTQSNLLPICGRPKVLTKIIST